MHDFVGEIPFPFFGRGGGDVQAYGGGRGERSGYDFEERGHVARQKDIAAVAVEDRGHQVRRFVDGDPCTKGLEGKQAGLEQEDRGEWPVPGSYFPAPRTNRA